MLHPVDSLPIELHPLLLLVVVLVLSSEYVFNGISARIQDSLGLFPTAGDDEMLLFRSLLLATLTLAGRR